MYCPSTRQLAMDVSPQDKHKVVEQKPPYSRDRLPPEFVSFKTDPSGWRTMRKRSRRLDAQHDKLASRLEVSRQWGVGAYQLRRCDRHDHWIVLLPHPPPRALTSATVA